MIDSPYGVTIGSKVNAAGQLKDAAIQDMQALNMTWVRFQIPALLINPRPGVYNFAGYDDAVKKANQAGLNICLSAKQFASFAIAGGFPTPAATSMFVRALCTRYDGKHGHGQIQAVDIWNEDGDNRAASPATPLAKALRLCWPIVKNINPDIRVVMGALLQRSSEHIAAYMDDLWSLADGFFDIAAFHFYTCIPDMGHFAADDETVPNVPSIRQFIALLRASHEKAGHASFPTWCTETGAAVNDNYGRKFPKCVTNEAGQWAFIQEVLQRSRESEFVEKVFLFTLGYNNHTPAHGEGTSDGMSIYQGLHGVGGFPTLAYKQYQQYTQNYPSWR